MNYKGFIAAVVLVVVAIAVTATVAFGASQHPDHDRAWQEAVATGCIQGDAEYYSSGAATQEEINHALLTCILSQQQPEPSYQQPVPDGVLSESCPAGHTIAIDSDTQPNFNGFLYVYSTNLPSGYSRVIQYDQNGAAFYSRDNPSHATYGPAARIVVCYTEDIYAWISNTTSTSTTTLPQPSTTTTVPAPTTSSSTTTSTTATTTTTLESSTPSLPTPTTTSTTVSPPTTTTTQPQPPAGTVLIQSGIHLNYSQKVVSGTRYVCEPQAILDGGGSTAYAFYGAADNVTIEGCEIRNYNNKHQFGAINQRGTPGNDWLILNNDIHHNNGAGIAAAGDRIVIRGNHVHHQDQIGLKYVTGSDGLIEGNEVNNNNRNGSVNWGWEAGGSKFAQTTGLVTRNNYFHDNHGPGIWYDIANHGGLIEGNTVEDNYAPGIFYEISDTGLIRDNNVKRNGFGSGTCSWLWGAGILVATSSDTIVEDNLLEDNCNGIAITFQDRTAYGVPYYALDNTFRNNTVLNSGHSGAVRDNGDDRVFDRNTFEGNTYVDQDTFAWNNSWGNLTWWRGFHPND